MKKRILSGVQPSGQLHIGNYFGMIERMVQFQNESDLFCFVANYHSMTSINDKVKLEENTRGVAGSTSFPSDSATRTDDFELFALSFNKFFKKGSVNISMNRSDNNQVYDDSNGSFPTLSKHELEYSLFKVDGKHSICLLYTSPSPRDATLSRMPSSA